MSPQISFQLLSAFAVVAVYAAVGWARWSMSLHDGFTVWLQYLATVLVYGNLLGGLMWLCSRLLRLIRCGTSLPVWGPLALFTFLMATGESAVKTNLDLPPLIGLSDPIRLELLMQAALQGLVVTAVALCGLGLAWRALGLGAKQPGGKSTLARNVWIAQLALTLVLVARTGMNLGPGTLEYEAQPSMRPTPGRDLALVCVDAAFWEIVDELIEEGMMPNVAALREEGVYGHLITYGQRLSPIVWTTLVTGVMEDKHGVHGWTEPSADRSRTVIVPSTSRSAAALWNISRAADLPTLVLNWLITAPPEEILGAVIPNLDDVFLNVFPRTYPESLASTVRAEYEAAGYVHDDPVAEPGQLVDLVDRVYSAVTQENVYPFVIMGTQATDHVQHNYFLHRYPDRYDGERWDKSPAALESFGDVIGDTYRRADEMIGRLRDDGRTILMVSDHGARERREPFANFLFNVVFADLGLAHLKLRDDGRESRKADADRSVVFEAGNDAWHNDLAFFIREEPLAGGVLPDRESLFEELRSLHVEETGEPLFDQVIDLAKDKSGRYKRHRKRGAAGVAVMASVLRKVPREKHVEVRGKRQLLARYIHIRQNINGSHDPRGLFLLAGGDVSARGPLDKLCLDTSFTEMLRYLIGTKGFLDPLIAGARRLGMMDPYTTLDIAPTVLAYLGLPVAEDMRGRIMGRALRDVAYRRTVCPTYDHLLEAGRTDSGISEEDNELMLDRLRALGYVN